MPQDVHAVMPDRFWACPGKQGKQKDCPALGWAYPIAHALHASMFDASVYVPGGQVVQIFSPVLVVSSYCPAKQSVHDVLPAKAKRPVPHEVHSVVLLLSVEAVSAWQSMQFAAPMTSLYSPWKQGMHDVCPALGWAYPSGHCAHASMFNAPVYVPGGQVVQIFSPVLVVSSYCPAKQSEQNVLPSAAVLPVPQVPHGVVRLVSFDAVSSRQFLHAASSSSSWYCPGMQPVHGRSTAAVNVSH